MECNSKVSESTYEVFRSIDVGMTINKTKEIHEMLQETYDSKETKRYNVKLFCQQCKEKKVMNCVTTWKNPPKHFHLTCSDFDGNEENKMNIPFENEKLNEFLYKKFEEKTFNYLLKCICWYERQETGHGHFFITRKMNDNKWKKINDDIISDITINDMKDMSVSSNLNITDMIFVNDMSQQISH